MSAEAIARLRATATMHSDFLHIPVSVDDLRALLDAHAKLEAARTEALDALRLVVDEFGWVSTIEDGHDCIDPVLAVLAKAGRR